jgi:rhodanese-related sulfurtransferase
VPVVEPIVAWSAAILVALSVFYLWFRPTPAQRARPIEEALAAGAWIVDVREPDEFAAGHIEGARNIPVTRLLDHLAELKAHEGGVILYCASGIRSVQAATVLGSKGVRVLDAGAMRSWPIRKG